MNGRIDYPFEVLIHEGDAIPMGDKLNRMFKEAKGQYVVCVDDDDYLDADYISWIFKCLLSHGDKNPDYIGYKILMTEDGKYTGMTTSKYDGDQNWVNQPQGVGPKWPVKREIAMKYEFPNMYIGDRIWSQQVRNDIKTGVFIDRIMYYYDFWNKGTLGTEPGSPNVTTQRDVGLYPYDRSKFKWLTV